MRLLKHVRDCGQESYSSTGWHLMVFSIETFRVQIFSSQLLNYKESRKHKRKFLV